MTYHRSWLPMAVCLTLVAASGPLGAHARQLSVSVTSEFVQPRNEVWRLTQASWGRTWSGASLRAFGGRRLLGRRTSDFVGLDAYRNTGEKTYLHAWGRVANGEVLPDAAARISLYRSAGSYEVSAGLHALTSPLGAHLAVRAGATRYGEGAAFGVGLMVAPSLRTSGPPAIAGRAVMRTQVGSSRLELTAAAGRELADETSTMRVVIPSRSVRATLQIPVIQRLTLTVGTGHTWAGSLSRTLAYVALTTRR